MPDYDLYRLDDRSFEKLTVALSLAAIGPGVEAFGDGPDGGREATFTGKIRWSKLFPTDAANWNGYCVIQAKYRPKKAAKLTTNLSWLKREIANELDKWKVDEKKRKRKQIPRYLIFVTNVELSSVAGKGGIDQIAQFMDEQIKPLREKGLVGWKVWHSDQISALLTVNDGVRKAFPAFLTAGDVLGALDEFFNDHSSQEIANRIRVSTQQSLSTERWVRFSEAGAGPSDKAEVESVAVDLPLTKPDWDPTNEPSSAAALVISHADSVLKPNDSDPGPRHLVLVGGPGQGKTTISQMLAQRYRAALLDNDDEPLGISEPVVRSTTDQLSAKDIPLPRNRRWPFRIDLADYAETIGPSGETSLLRWISKSISDRGATEVTPAHLHGWLQRWPWLLLLDGLDEIASPDSRANVVERIDDLLVEASTSDMDLVVVVTTRPMGYDDRLDSKRFRHIVLADLDPIRAMSFARHLASVRFDDDPEMRELVLERLEAAAGNSLTTRLFRTPLQVTIMSFIVEQTKRLPPDRFSLFEMYFNTVYAREASKPGYIGELLTDHRAHIEFVHEEVAIRIHAIAENSGHTDAFLPEDTLKGIVRDRLTGLQFSGVDVMTEQIVNAAMNRLVLLVPKREGVGFEVRSFQEFMAARAATYGEDPDVLERLRITAHSPHWRNAWLFAAGAIFSKREHMIRPMIDLFSTIDNGLDKLGGVIPSAPELALDVLDDGLSTAFPIWTQQVVDVALRIVLDVPTFDADRVARLLVRLSTTGHARSQIFGHIVNGVEGSAGSRASSAILLDYMDAYSSAQAQVGNDVRLADARLHLTQDERDAINIWCAIRGWNAMGIDYRRPDLKSTRLKALLSERLSTLGASSDVMAALEPTLIHLGDLMYVASENGYKFAGTPSSLPADLATDVTNNDEAAMTLQLLIQSIDPDDWSVRAMIDTSLIPPIRRQQVAAQVLESRRKSVASL